MMDRHKSWLIALIVVVVLVVLFLAFYSPARVALSGKAGEDGTPSVISCTSNSDCASANCVGDTAGKICCDNGEDNVAQQCVAGINTLQNQIAGILRDSTTTNTLESKISAIIHLLKNCLEGNCQPPRQPVT